MRSEEYTIVLQKRLSAVYAAVCELCLPINSMTANENSKSNSEHNNDLEEDDYRWIATNPPYYSGQLSVLSSGFTIIGSGLFGSSFGVMQRDQFAWLFPWMLFGGITCVLVGWILMGMHTKCEIVKAAKLREDDLRKDRINRYCKRYKKLARKFLKTHAILAGHNLKIMFEANPLYLKSNAELVKAFDILEESDCSTELNKADVEQDLLGFFLEARKQRKHLDAEGDHFLLGIWKATRALEL